MKHLIPYLVGFSVEVIFKTLHTQVSDFLMKWSIKKCFKYAFQHNIKTHELTSQKYFNFESASCIIIKSLK